MSNIFGSGIVLPEIPKKLDDPKHLKKWIDDLYTSLTTTILPIHKRLNGIMSEGLESDLPPAGGDLRLFYAQDSEVLYFDNGSAWTALN